MLRSPYLKRGRPCFYFRTLCLWDTNSSEGMFLKDDLIPLCKATSVNLNLRWYRDVLTFERKKMLLKYS